MPLRTDYRPNAMFITTRRCNYRCRMCYMSDPAVLQGIRPEDAVMPMDLFARMLEASAPICGSISLTAQGEFLADPLLEERLALLGEHLRRHPDLRFHQLTNGALLDRKCLEFLRGAGGVLFSVSLDSTDFLEYATIRRPGRWSRVRDNLLNLRANLRRVGTEKVDLVLGVVLMKRNLFTFPEVIRLAHELGASIVWDHVARLGENGCQGESLFHHPVFANAMLDKFAQLAERLGVRVDGPPPFWPSPEAPPEAPDLESARECYQLEREGPFQICPDGTVQACCQALPVGNVNDRPLEAILSGPEVQALRDAIAQGHPLPPCDHCRFLRRRRVGALHDAQDYGWDIPPSKRDYRPWPDLEEGGYLDWLQELPHDYLMDQLRAHYLDRAQGLIQAGLVDDGTPWQLRKAKHANEVLLDVLRARAKAVVYAAGQDSAWLMANTLLDQVSILAFADRDPAKAGTRHLGFPVVPPERIQGLAPDVVLVASERYRDSILASLRDRLGPDAAILSLF